MSKYNSKKITVDGIQFDSKIEAQYYHHLKLLKAKGEVRSFDLQPRYELQPAFEKNGKKYRKMEYVADFLVEYSDGKQEVVDIKGMELETYKIKVKLFEYRYPDLILKSLKYVVKFGGFITIDEYKKRKKEEKKK